MACVEAAQVKLEEANKNLETLKVMESLGIHNVFKLKRRILAEVRFLHKVTKHEANFKKEHVNSSNINHLSAVVNLAKSLTEVTSVLESFPLTELGKKIVVDVVCNGGSRWVKIILRKAEALHHLYLCGERDGTKPLNLVAKEFLLCAKQHPHLYVTPEVSFIFMQGVSKELAECLTSLGVHVEGEVVSVPTETTVEDGSTPNSDGEWYSDGENSESEPHGDDPLGDEPLGEHDPGKCSQPVLPKAVNLDVTALVAYVTATSNGGCNFTFEDQFLQDQAKWEREKPVKKTLDSYFEGNSLYMCEEGLTHFMEIVELIGGPAEKERAKEFAKEINVVKGIDLFKEDLKIGGRVKGLARLIFGTGEAMQMVTITANHGFVRAAKNQNVNLAVKYHGPRALTEMKEKDALPYCENLNIS